MDGEEGDATSRRTSKEEDDRAQRRVGKRLQRIFRLGRRWRRNGHRGCRRNGTWWARARRVGTRALRRCRRTVRRRARAKARTRWPMARRSVCGRCEPVRRPLAGSSGRAHFHDHFRHVGRLSCRRSRRFGPRRRCQSRFRRSGGLGLNRLSALLGLKAHIVSTSGLTRRSSSRVTSYKSAKAIRFPISGRRLGALPLGNGLARQPQLLGQPLLGEPALTAQFGKALGDFDVHHGSLSRLVRHISPFTLWFQPWLHQHLMWSIYQNRAKNLRQPLVAPPTNR